MKKYFFIALITAFAICAKAQTATTVAPAATVNPAVTAAKARLAEAKTNPLYHPEADAKAEIAAAIKKAAAENKNVLLQWGGNWCIWCLRFHDLVKSDADLTKYMNDNFVVLHVNYSPENKNEDILASQGYPQRFGFPVFVILDSKGNRLHTQDSAFLEEGDGHSKKKVMEFFRAWTTTAIDPKTYAPKPKPATAN
ncbi:thioredoxin family protein [Mucilaginibacter myungsuensis]|uniref:Thioredoxin family protein n=1 Tax=Mucilaginibacter myungsuensis TaxID=649104 RepID=A0A929KVD0_9SPHI|nr:thioredoxin family protein [Mucilaginibacter myungsuensis]MBE9661123.1 thioredoxin family protein [Mucilaginibacter myungsuensis]MDN3597268.1 thioredoxin family protein [Mucilaginibacter myungsuensis]